MRMQDGFRKANLSAFVGVTTGKAFCGTVGNAQRNEYAVVGSVVNLSARLMVAATNLLSSDPGEWLSFYYLRFLFQFLLTCSSFHFVLFAKAIVF